jgi:putative colanic acid biosynthesis acetyltransferase WcaF
MLRAEIRNQEILANLESGLDRYYRSELVEPGGAGAVNLSGYRDPKPAVYLLKRLLWSCVQVPFWPKMPRRLSPLRIALLRLFGAKIGRRCLLESARIWVPWNLHMDEFSVIGNGAEIYNLAPIRIGANSVVSQRAYLCTATHDYTRSDFPLYSKPIAVGASVWIAAGAFIAPGINVGEGAVVGACSVVTKDVPAWTVSAGNPCRVIKARPLENRSDQRQIAAEAGTARVDEATTTRTG